MKEKLNIVWHNSHLTKEQRASLKSQRPCVLWFTGLSGSGKSTIANAVEAKLHQLQKHTYLLDGDNVRHGLNKGLGFSDADRIENIRRVGEVAKLFVDAGLIVLTAFISPFQKDRQMVRDLVEQGEFIEVFVDAPLAICEQRDPKGLYKKARAGEIKNFTGIDSPYEPPVNAEIVIENNGISVEAAAEQVVSYLQSKQYI
ncbi:MAG: adenylyl-sulfate kinase [Hydrogenovibrio sp.]|uniref:adenylyl-sulfate kinase n=1 Tax=Hydrogenovibrio sp. TaxID=2065821 RepID=UPI0028708E18|nr:adenylyl-sulfate kinase [Hydrogenovibrio sp.]MDR9498501.1 adenylyl-sulfate kinase [Hydrogenovibrio sp.]MDR9499269.1 adenylyl-sulfate kinase [Hydrogenovibrio sp.]